MCKSDTEWLAVASCLFIIAMLVILAVLSTPGEFVTLYAIIGVLTILPALYQSRARRIWAVVTTLIVILLIIWDHQAGKKYRRNLTEIETPRATSP
jgi:hypothetical protein